jgi:DNA-binding CsgD family transcriptional regulator
MGTTRAQLTPRRNGHAQPVIGLTQVEITILRWLSVGKRYAEIGLIMGMTEGAAHIHVHRILNKLGASNATGAVGIALRKRLIE